MSEWILVSDGLPRSYINVLVTADNGELYIASKNPDDTFYFYEELEFYDTQAIAWMPLPKPFREGERNMSEWIPVSERLPEGGINVLLTIDYNGFRYLTVAISEADGVFADACKLRYNYKSTGSFNPVAWMPLPEPYGEEDEKC